MTNSIFRWADPGPVHTCPLDGSSKVDYVGEAKVLSVDDNGLYTVVCSAGQFTGRPTFNIGENFLKSGVAVAITVCNREALITGRLRVTRDDLDRDGKVKQDKSSTIGSPGDATLRPHTTVDKDATSEVTVTGGNVVKVKSNSNTYMNMHPTNDAIQMACSEFIQYTDAYRMQSGKTSTSSATSATLNTITTQSFKSKQGSSRTEVTVKNGTVSGNVVHDFSVGSLSTGGGKTTGDVEFNWTIDKDGNWQVQNSKTIKFGDTADQAMVLGDELVALEKKLIAEMNALRTDMIAASATLLGGASALTSVVAEYIKLTIDVPAGKLVLGPALVAFASTVTAAATTLTKSATKSKLSLTALGKLYLLSKGVTKEKILSDYCSLQKKAPKQGIHS